MAATSYMSQKQATVSFIVNFYPGACADAAVIVPSNLTFKMINYTIMEEPKRQIFQPFSDSVQESKGVLGVCGQRAYIVTQEFNFLTIQAPPNGMELTDDWAIELSSSDMNQAGLYQVALVAKLVDYPNAKHAVYNFQIELLDPCLTTQIDSQAINNMVYRVGDSSATQDFQQFSDSVSQIQADPKFCGDREYRLIGAPAFVKLTVPLNQGVEPCSIEVQTLNETDAGTYRITLSARLVNYNLVSEATSTFVLEVQGPKFNKKPYFVTKLESPLAIQMTLKEQAWKYTFPQIHDDDKSGELKMNVDLGGAQNFLVFEENSLEIANIADAIKVKPGFYFIKVTISDSIDKVEFQIMLIVYEPIQESVQAAICTVQFTSPENQEISYKSGSTPLKVSWPSFKVETDCNSTEFALELKTEWSDDRFTQDSDWLSISSYSLDNSQDTNFFIISSKEIFGEPFQAEVFVIAALAPQTAQFKINVTILPRQADQKPKDSSFVLPPQMKIAKFDVTGQLVLTFNQKVVIYDDPSDIFMKQPQDFLKIFVEKNPKNRYSENQKYIESGSVLSIKVLSFQETEIKLQIELSNPLYVSLDPLNQDTMNVDVIDTSYFVSAADLQTTMLAGKRLQILIESPIAPASAIETIKNINQNAQRANIIATSSIPINVVLGVSLKYLWGLVNPLQFVVYMKEWKVNWPPNARLIVETLETIALGKFIEKDKIKRKFMDFYGLQISYDNEISSRQLSEKKDVHKGRVVGTAVGLAIFLCALIIGLGLMLRTKYDEKIVQMGIYIKKTLFWNFFIRSFLQSFLSQSIWIIGFYMPQSPLITSKNKKAKMYTATFVMLLLIPATLIYLMQRYFLRLKEVYTTERYGSLYLGVRTNNRWSAFLFVTYLLIRLSFAVITIMLRPWPGVLVLSFMVINMISIVYLCLVRPYVAVLQQAIELFNSIILQLIAYIMICLTNLVSGPESEFQIGWALIGVVGFIFIGNLTLMLGINIQIIFRRIYQKYLRYQKKRQQTQDDQPVEAVFQQNSQLQADAFEIVPQSERGLQPSERVSSGLILVPDMSVEHTDRNFSNQNQLLLRRDQGSQNSKQELDLINRFAQRTATQIIDESQKGNRERSESFADFDLPEPILVPDNRQQICIELRRRNTTTDQIFRKANGAPHESQIMEETPQFGPKVVVDCPSLPDYSVQNSFSGASKQVIKSIRRKNTTRLVKRNPFTDD